MGADGGADPLALHLADVRKTDGAFVEQSGRNQSQPVAKRTATKTELAEAKILAVGCDRLPPGPYGKEGVEGYLFLGVVMDMCSRKIVGWSMRDGGHTPAAEKIQGRVASGEASRSLPTARIQPAKVLRAASSAVSSGARRGPPDRCHATLASRTVKLRFPTCIRVAVRSYACSHSRTSGITSAIGEGPPRSGRTRTRQPRPVH